MAVVILLHGKSRKLLLATFALCLDGVEVHMNHDRGS